MKKLNLKNEYYWITKDEYIEIPDAVAEIFTDFAKAEHRYLEKVRYHKAFYSLDGGNGIEKDIIFVSQLPDELYEKKLSQAELYAAISQLPETQAKRIYAHYFQNLTYSEIAKSDGVDESAVRHSVKRGLRQIEKILNFF
ncbi:MAG: sigma-70 family RNA polymerase sigma factor [Clostridia bacterium]|nr:sigma-70 family RNA polymerase sigma factor [Clostridia bacterium]